MQRYHLIAIASFAFTIAEALPGCVTSKAARQGSPEPGRMFKMTTHRSKGLSANIVPPSSRQTGASISRWEETIVPNANRLHLSSSSGRQSGEKGQGSSSHHELSEWALSQQYRLSRPSSTTLSEKALRNLNLLPSDPLKAEVDHRYGIGTSKLIEARKKRRREVRRVLSSSSAAGDKTTQDSKQKEGMIKKYSSFPGWEVTIPEHRRAADTQSSSSSSSEW